MAAAGFGLFGKGAPSLSASLGRKFPIGVQGQSPGKASGKKSPLQKLMIICKLRILQKKAKTIFCQLRITEGRFIHCSDGRCEGVRTNPANPVDPRLKRSSSSKCRQRQAIRRKRNKNVTSVGLVHDSFQAESASTILCCTGLRCTTKE